ncbi:hypothetical protein EV363DRAFT_782228 [Boletus edulis]|nr:hypothetical protein EV363DRAFT_782228 [Boletus edulis]
MRSMQASMIAGVGIWTLLRWLYTTRRKFHTAQLHGPPSESFLYGVGRRTGILSADSEDSGAIYEAWGQEYSPVFAAPSTLGSTEYTGISRVVVPSVTEHFDY